MTSTPYVVLLKKQECLKPVVIARVLAAMQKVHAQDMMNTAKEGWGVVAENLEMNAAKELESQLNAASLESLAIPQNLLEDLPPLRAVSKAEIEEDALRLPLDSEDWERVSWKRWTLVAAAGFDQTTSRTVTTQQGPALSQKVMSLGLMALGIPVSLGPKKKEVRKTVESSDTVFFLDLVARNPDLHVRIDAQNFNYSCLKEKMVYNVLENLRLFLAEVVHHTTNPLLNQGTKILLERKPILEMNYRSLEDLERESRWLLTLRALNLA